MAVYPKDDFYYSCKGYAIPNIHVMSDRVVEMLTNEAFCKIAVEQSFNCARSLCHLPHLIDQFLDIVEQTEKPC